MVRLDGFIFDLAACDSTFTNFGSGHCIVSQFGRMHSASREMPCIYAANRNLISGYGVIFD
ncbi:hypothetical protein D3C76_1727870 [compost metagenome]